MVAAVKALPAAPGVNGAIGDWRASAERIAGQDAEEAVREVARKLAGHPPSANIEKSREENIAAVNADLRRWQMAMNVALDAERQRGNQHFSIAGAYQLLNLKAALDAIALNDEPLMLEPYAAAALSAGFSPPPAPASPAGQQPEPETEKPPQGQAAAAGGSSNGK